MTARKRARHTNLMINDNLLRLATIDIGSNAIRLYIGQKSRTGRLRILEDHRASIRLGKDAFSTGYIRPNTQIELVNALQVFRDICDELNVDQIRAVGTSALRDSKNGHKVIEQLKNRTGIQVRIINGQREAELLHRAVTHNINLGVKSALITDMGGGSLEVVLSRKGRLVSKQSMPLGTVRLLSKVKPNPTYEDIARLVRTPLYRLRFEMLGRTQTPVQVLVGTGGNLRALGKLCFRLGLSRSRSRFQRAHLEILVTKLFALRLNERKKRFQLRPDRADVILPAAVVTLEMMRVFEIKEILVPNVGLKNGLFLEIMDRVKFIKPAKIRE